MNGQLEILRTRLIGTDLEQFEDNEELLRYALNYAEGEIMNRRGSDTLEQKYRRNQIEGAVWYLSRIGAEGAASISENGISVNYEEVPSWLRSILPRIGVVKRASET